MINPQYSILCYGDSNTWGTDPHTYQRFPRSVRWTGVLQQRLGDRYEIIADGLRSRTTVWDDPLYDSYPGHKNGKAHLWSVMESHHPLDLVILFLGTNDLNRKLGKDSYVASRGVAVLANIVKSSGLGPQPNTSPRVLILAPTPIHPAGPLVEEFAAAEVRSADFAKHYGQAARETGSHFLDTATVWNPSPLDGVHFEAAEHAKLALAIEAIIREALP